MGTTDYLRNPSDQRFRGAAVDLKNPTLSDTVDEPNGVSKGLMISDATTMISFITEKGSTVSFAAADLANGVIHPIRVKRVRATGTTMANTKIWLAY